LVSAKINYGVGGRRKSMLRRPGSIEELSNREKITNGCSIVGKGCSS
jgi:hypothetical protein